MSAKKNIVRKSILDAQLNIELIKLFENSNTDKGNCWEQVTLKYKIRKQRFYEKFNEALHDWQKTKQNALNDGVYANTIISLKMGLKPKLQRQLEIQAEIMDLQHRLIANTTKDVFIDLKKGVPKNYERNLTPGEIAQYKKTIAILNIELSKMAGDYAPAKQEFKNTTPLQPSDSQFNELLKQARETSTDTSK